MILALLATLGAIVVAFVLYPVFTSAPVIGPSELDESELALSELSDKKAMLYEAIQDLDFEKAAGKVSDTDYETARNDYLAQVSAVMESMDALTPKNQEPKKPSKKAAKREKRDMELECDGCGEHNPKGSKFCLECGKPVAATCASCGESLPAKARFCNACGKKVTA
ncbi:MAG: hypothetical protein BMS9Abin37_2014 [Acidobacteriota bacterium]|nr:MAG: hypothetical protein BMS9Abin37_2014 [Acidobacteriota bacterium]